MCIQFEYHKLCVQFEYHKLCVQFEYHKLCVQFEYHKLLYPMRKAKIIGMQGNSIYTDSMLCLLESLLSVKK